ncbi:MAG TPA: lipopolysaccharide biosynthesis protein [Rhodocyclaceae bacterium]|nr:lipopolysaccharide biosynthesis protein [Rhodocyclaceae bacterium]
MSGLRKALILSLGQRYTQLILQFVSSVIIARLLSPKEVGIFSISAALITIAHTLRDFGLGDYIIQERELTAEKVASAFTITLLIGVSLALVLIGAAPFAASIYKEDGLRRVLQVLAFNFALLPFASIGFAMLTRDIRFDAIFMIQTASGITQCIVSVWLAWRGHSYMSLAWGSLANNICTLLMLRMLARSEFPMRLRFKGLRDVGRFGITSASANLINEMGRNAHEFVIGYTLGFAAVGLLNKASGLLDTFHLAITQAASRVLLPIFSSRHHADSGVIDDYCRTAQIYTALAWPFFGLCAILAHPIIALLFGAKWMESAPLVQISAMAASVYATYCFAPHVLTATGNVGYKLRANAIGVPVQVAMMAAASLVSLKAVATMGVVATTMWFFLYAYLLKRSIGFSMGSFLRGFRNSGIVSLLTLGIAGVVDHYLQLQAPIINLLGVGSVGALVWLIAVRLLHEQLWTELSGAFSHVSNFIRHKFASP